MITPFCQGWYMATFAGSESYHRSATEAAIWIETVRSVYTLALKQPPQEREEDDRHQLP